MIPAIYFGRIQHFDKSIGQHYWSALKRQFQDCCAESVRYHFPSFSCSLGLFLGRFPCSAAPPRCNVPVQRALYNGASTGPESLRAIVTAERLSVCPSVDCIGCRQVAPVRPSASARISHTHRAPDCDSQLSASTSVGHSPDGSLTINAMMDGPGRA